MEIWKPLKSILIENYFVEYVFFFIIKASTLFAVDCILVGAHFGRNVKISVVDDSITGFLHAKSFKFNLSYNFPYVFYAILANYAHKVLNVIYEKCMRLIESQSIFTRWFWQRFIKFFIIVLFSSFAYSFTSVQQFNVLSYNLYGWRAHHVKSHNSCF